MSGISGFFRRVFGVERIGNLQLNYLSVLVYLETTPKENRATSAEKLGVELGITERTVNNAFEHLLDSKYIDLASDQAQSVNPYEVHDPKAFVVTPLGKRALRPFLGSFGFLTVMFLTGFSFAFGVIFGTLLFSSNLYPSYSLALAIVAVFLFAVMAASFYGVLSIGNDWRRTVIPAVLRKKKRR